MTVSEQIQITRKAHGLTRKQLGYAVGCTDQTIYNIESGRRPLTSPFILACLDALRIPHPPELDQSEPDPDSDLAPHLAGRPRCQVCGCLLFPTPDLVPAGWIAEWHMDAGNGNCLEHAGPEWLGKRMKHL